MSLPSRQQPGKSFDSISGLVWQRGASCWKEGQAEKKKEPETHGMNCARKSLDPFRFKEYMTFYVDISKQPQNKMKSIGVCVR